MSSTPSAPAVILAHRTPQAEPRPQRTQFASPFGSADGASGINPDTLAEVTAEVAREVIASHRGVWSSLARTVYLASPDRIDCARAMRCQPLPGAAHPAARAPQLSGHLHEERVDPHEDAGDLPAGGCSARTVRVLAEESEPPADADAPLAVVAELIAAGVARDLLDCVAAAERHRSAQLAVALVTNRRIAMAQGILMALHQLTAEQALDRMKESSQNHNRRLRDIAESVILTGALPPWRPSHRPRHSRQSLLSVRDGATW